MAKLVAVAVLAADNIVRKTQFQSQRNYAYFSKHIRITSVGTIGKLEHRLPLNLFNEAFKVVGA